MDSSAERPWAGETEEAPTPFHAGEVRVQALAGVEEGIEAWARKVVRPYLPEEHRAFYAALPFVVVAARDDGGRPWVTLLGGEPGATHSPNPHTLSLPALPDEGDAFAGAWRAGAEVGVLGIELHTRRRNRVNGSLRAVGPHGADLAVSQTFGNCPQYITARGWAPLGPGSQGAVPARRANALEPSDRTLIARADTLFIGSGFCGRGEHEAYGMDASHRGGDPGFVEVHGPTTLSIPDYAGNNHFNTLGNLHLDPRAGLLVPDFECGAALQLTGRAHIDWNPSEEERAGGILRRIVFEVDEVVYRESALPVRFDAPGARARELRVVGRRRESDDTVSFTFAARDGRPLPPFRAGQYLPLDLETSAGRVNRTYTLSGSPRDSRYRITVKRAAQGAASRALHDAVKEGDILESAAPQGVFGASLHTDAVVSKRRAVVLMSAGVGVTPMVSLLHELAAADDPREVHFFHVARDGRHHPLAAEVAALIEARPDWGLHVAYTRPGLGDRRGAAFERCGRPDANWLAEHLRLEDADIYLCGPGAFMASMVAGLEARGVPAARIHTESFGPSAHPR